MKSTSFAFLNTFFVHFCVKQLFPFYFLHLVFHNLSASESKMSKYLEIIK